MSGNGVDYGYEPTGFLTPQLRAKPSIGRRLSLGTKRAVNKAPILEAPSSPLARSGQSGQSFTHVSMLGEVAVEASPGAHELSPAGVPQTTGGHRRKLKLGSLLQSSLHASSTHQDDRSVFSENPVRRGSIKGLRSKLRISKLAKSERQIQEPGALERFLNDSDHDQDFQFKSSTKKSVATHTGTFETNSLPGTPKSKKKKKVVADAADDQSEGGTVTSAKRRKKKKAVAAGEESPGTISKKKVRSSSKGKKSVAGDDVSVGSRKTRKSRASSKPKTKINAWGEEVEEVSEDETYVHSLYGDDASTSKPRRRRRKKKTDNATEDDEEETPRPAAASIHSKESEEVERRRLALEQELDAMLDISNHKIPEVEISKPVPPPPLRENSPLIAGPPVDPRANPRASATNSEYRKTSPQTFADDDDIQSLEDEDRPPIESLTFSQRKNRTIPNVPALDEQSQTNHSHSHVSRLVTPGEDKAEHIYVNRTYEYALGDTTSDEDESQPSSFRRSKVPPPPPPLDGNESVSSKKSANSRASKISSKFSPKYVARKGSTHSQDSSLGSPRFPMRKGSTHSQESSVVSPRFPILKGSTHSDDASAMSASSLRKKGAEQKAMNKKMDSMLDQLEKYEANLGEEMARMRKKLENMTIEKEYLANKNRQLEAKIEQMKDKAAEDADRLLNASRNKNKSSEEIEDLKIENEILREKVERHEATLLRMNGARSVRGMRSIITQMDDPDSHDKELAEKDKEITKLKADLALLRDQLRYKSEDYDKQAVELYEARKELTEARHTLKHTGTFKYHNKFEELQQEKIKNKSQQEVALSSFFDD